MRTSVYFLFALIFIVGCSQKSPSKAEDKQTTYATSPKIELGFNAKGTLNTPEQLRMFEDLLKTLPSALVQHLHVRVSGGTLSQRQVPADWTDADISAWIALQGSYGFGLVYVVNGNDTPESQAQFVEKWLDMGARFSFIEMMNEYYLSKYKAGDTSKPGVTREVTYTTYVEDLLPAFIGPLAEFNVPLFLICAPMKGKQKVDGYNELWNAAVIEVLNADVYKVPLGVSIHLYFDGGEFDYEQLTRLRENLPKGMPIAVTESGLATRDTYNYDEAGALITGHYRSIASKLQPGDYLFDHVLYNNYKRDFNATLHPYFKGLSPKGTYVVNWMTEVYTE